MFMTIKSLVNVFDNVVDPMEDIDWNEIEEDEENDYFDDPMVAQYLGEGDHDDEDEDFQDIDNWIDPDLESNPIHLICLSIILILVLKHLNLQIDIMMM